MKLIILFLPLFAQAQISVSDRAPIELILLFQGMSQKEASDLSNDIELINKNSLKVESSLLKRVIKHSIYASLLSFKNSKLQNENLDDFLTLRVNKDAPIFTKWLSKAVKQDILQLKALPTHSQRVQESRFKKYLIPLIHKLKQKDNKWLADLRRKVCKQLPYKLLSISKSNRIDQGSKLIIHKATAPTRVESLNKLIDSL